MAVAKKPSQDASSGIAPGAKNTIDGRNVSPATQRIRAANQGKTGPGFAPGSRPNVITVSGGAVFSNGKLISNYGAGPEAAKKAQEKADLYLRPNASGRITGVMGDKGGETFRQLYRVDQGKQTGKANVEGVIGSMGSRGMTTQMDGGRITGAVKDRVEQRGDKLYVKGKLVATTSGGDEMRNTIAREREKLDREDAQNASFGAQNQAAKDRQKAGFQAQGILSQKPQKGISPALFSRTAPVLRDQSKEAAARDKLIISEGINIEEASPTKLRLLDEKVNEDVYGQAYPTFKNGAGVLSAEQKTQEMAVAAGASGAALKSGAAEGESPIDEKTGNVRTVITSDEARQYTDEQRKRLTEFQSGADATATGTVNGLADTDADVAAAIAAGEDATALLEQRREFYGQVYNDTVERIKQSFDEKESSYRTAAAQEMGQTVSMLARMGAYGTTSAGVQYINDVNRENEAKILSLAAEESAAIQKSFEAFQEGDFAIAEKMIQVASDSRKEVRTIRSENLDRQIKLKQLQKLEQEEASATVSTLITAGYEPGDLPTGYLESLDAKQGLPYGTSERLYGVGMAQKAAAAQADAAERHKAEISNAKDIVGLMQDLPPGTSMTIDGTEYTSINTGEWTTGTETDSNGNTSLWSYNKDTGETRTQSLGNIGKVAGWEQKTDNNGNIIGINPNTGEMRVIYNASTGEGTGIATGGIFSAFPQGSKSTFTESDGTLRTQCGEWVNDITGIGVGDGLLDKIGKMDPALGFGDGQTMPSIGDVFTENVGTWGHVGIINQITPLEDGDYMLTVSESNYKKDASGVGLITHDRQVRASSLSKGLGGRATFASPGFKDNSYNWGTDNSGLQLDFSDKKDTEVTFTEKAALRKEIAADKAIVQYGDIKTSFDNITALYQETVNKPSEESKQALDNAIIIAFNKMLDPGSVVREGEFDRTTQGQSIMANFQGFLDAKTAGGAGITDDTRREMVRAAEILANNAEAAYQDSVDFYVPAIEEYGLDPARYIKGYQVGTGTMSDPGRESRVYDDASDPEIQQALDAGWSAFQREDGSVVISSP